MSAKHLSYLFSKMTSGFSATILILLQTEAMLHVSGARCQTYAACVEGYSEPEVVSLTVCKSVFLINYVVCWCFQSSTPSLVNHVHTMTPSQQARSWSVQTLPAGINSLQTST